MKRKVLISASYLSICFFIVFLSQAFCFKLNKVKLSENDSVVKHSCSSPVAKTSNNTVIETPHDNHSESNLASSNTRKKNELTIEELIKKASEFNIEIIDWRNISDSEIFCINFIELKDQRKWIDFLQSRFSGSHAISFHEDKVVLYLLPKGVDADFVNWARNFSNETNLQKNFSNFKKSKGINAENIMQLPEIVVLKNFAEIEKTHVISYKRFVNSPQISNAYNFKVKYFDSIGKFAPFERNGLAIKGQMVGFSSYHTYFDTIIKQSEKIKARRYENDLYFSIDDVFKTQISIKLTDNNLEISSKASQAGDPVIEVYLNGNENEFNTYTNIYSSNGIVTLLDKAKIK